jgi:hypothetical protein
VTGPATRVAIHYIGVSATSAISLQLDGQIAPDHTDALPDATRLLASVTERVGATAAPAPEAPSPSTDPSTGTLRVPPAPVPPPPGAPKSRL